MLSAWGGVEWRRVCEVVHGGWGVGGVNGKQEHPPHHSSASQCRIIPLHHTVRTHKYHNTNGKEKIGFFAFSSSSFQHLRSLCSHLLHVQKLVRHYCSCDKDQRTCQFVFVYLCSDISASGQTGQTTELHQPNNTLSGPLDLNIFNIMCLPHRPIYANAASI